ncbi:MAG: DUF72 domain-containing protein [Candidatus Eisenbacteria bacterium]|uniref:DUF72 domain-containing protein n=1 Tax=Eiseniibacteriota bacterium TaxID=2212470 RepID=A0A7Y2EA32_UNCEI|nr:DUF72 domain-containing protein [Candidatus Eisenbacteria bacterium]
MKTPLFWGTSSFSSKDWVGPFYPPGTKAKEYLALYAKQFPSVEIDSTYYGVPRESTVDLWRERTPEGFVISSKFPREIVHGGTGARPNGETVLLPEATYAVRDEYLSVMSRLENRLGPMVLQFPFFSRDVFPRTQLFMDRLHQFLADLPSGFRYVVEVRNKHWVSADLAEICREHEVAMALVDQGWMPHGDEVEKRMDPVTADFSYIRLLGDHKAIERITKTWDKEVIDQNERLQRWASLIRRLLDREVPTFVYVNNHYAGHAPATLRRLQSLVESKKPGIPI